MAIIHLVTGFRLGGAEKVAFSLAKSKPDSTVVGIFDSPHDRYKNGLLKDLQQSGVNTVCLGFKETKGPLAYFFLLLSAVKFYIFLRRKSKRCIVHSHTDFPDFVLSISLRLFKLFGGSPPHIIRTIHNVKLWPTHGRIAKLVESSFDSDRVIFVSEGAREAYINLRVLTGNRQSKFQNLIYNGVDEKPFNIARDKRKRRKVQSPLRFLFIGRFTFQKGLDILVDAISKLEDSTLNKVEFHFYGHGELEDLLIKNSANFPIIVNPPVNDVSLLFPHFDALVMPSRFEGLGLVAIESFLSKLPVILPPAPGLIEVFDSKWPLVFDLESSDSLKNIIVNFVNEDVVFEPQLQNTANIMKIKFSHQSMLEKYALEYDSFN